MKKLLTLLLLSFGLNAAAQPTHLFSAGEHGYKCFRIPTIVQSNKGTLLAFAEARKSNCSDTGDIDLMVRRSTDGGKTWGAPILVWDDGENVCGNPSAVVDRTTGRIVLASTWNLGSDHESDIIYGRSKEPRRVFVLSSDDDGLTWSAAQEITATTKKPEWRWYATGPVHGIQLQNGPHKGRLVFAANHSLERKEGEKGWPYYAHCIFSDDGGATWALGGTTALGGNESSVVELADGSVMINMRNYNREVGKCRSYSISRDGGATWGEMLYARDLVEPVCQGAALNYTDKKGRPTETLLFLNPASETKREMLTLKKSTDSGQSYDAGKVVYPGPAAYSDLVQLKNGKIGVFYENGDKNPYERISFEVVDLKK